MKVYCNCLISNRGYATLMDETLRSDEKLGFICHSCLRTIEIELTSNEHSRPEPSSTG